MQLVAMTLLCLLSISARTDALTTWLQHQKPCEMGLTAGYWEWNATAGSRWRTAEPCPQYENLLLGVKNASRTTVLFLGDSLDVHTLLSYCRLLQQQFTYHGRTHRHDFMGFCTDAKNADRMIGIQLAMKGIPGVHMEGPFNMHVSGNFINRTLSAKNETLVKFGRMPDLVMVSSCYWDNMRITYHETLPRSNHYPHALVQSWKANFTLFLGVVKQQFPEAVIALRTEPLTAFKTKVGFIWHQINQLRQAGMQVAIQNGVQVIDVYSMCFGERPDQYLKSDGYHVVDEVNLEVMNIALNMLSVRRQTRYRELD